MKLSSENVKLNVRKRNSGVQVPYWYTPRRGVIVQDGPAPWWRWGGIKGTIPRLLSPKGNKVLNLRIISQAP